MHTATEVFDTSAISIGGDSEHGLQVAEPRIPAALEIPIPRHGCAGLHRQLQPVVSQSQFYFGEFARCDIRNHSANAQFSAGPIVELAAARFHPEHATIRRDYAMAYLNAGVFGVEFGKGGDQSFSVIRVDYGQQLFANNVRSFVDSEDLRAFPGEHGHARTGVPLESKHPARLGCKTKALLTLSQCLQSLESDS